MCQSTQSSCCQSMQRICMVTFIPWDRKTWRKKSSILIIVVRGTCFDFSWWFGQGKILYDMEERVVRCGMLYYSNEGKEQSATRSFLSSFSISWIYCHSSNISHYLVIFVQWVLSCTTFLNLVLASSDTRIKRFWVMRIELNLSFETHFGL